MRRLSDAEHIISLREDNGPVLRAGPGESTDYTDGTDEVVFNSLDRAEVLLYAGPRQ